jgi:two-component system nitrate/nitrite response regulator NarL
MVNPHINLVIVDSRRLVCELLLTCLVPEHVDELHFFESLGELEGMLEAGMSPHVVLIGCTRASETDLQVAASLLKRFDGRVALLCDFMPLATLDRLLDSNIHGFLQTSMQFAEFSYAIRQIANQSLYIPPEYVRATLTRQQRPYGLTDRQLSVLQLIILGKQNKEISDTLGIGEAIVKAETRKICQKLGVRNRTQAAMKATSARIG